MGNKAELVMRDIHDAIQFNNQLSCANGFKTRAVEGGKRALDQSISHIRPKKL